MWIKVEAKSGLIMKFTLRGYLAWRWHQVLSKLGLRKPKTRFVWTGIMRSYGANATRGVATRLIGGSHE